MSATAALWPSHGGDQRDGCGDERMICARRALISQRPNTTESTSEVSLPQADQLMWIPEIARLITKRCTSDVPSKMV